MGNEAMHVGIEEPVQKRKEVLNVAIDSIQALKGFELYKRINKEKDVYRKHFIQVIKELSIAINAFKEHMPPLYVHKEEEEKAEEQAKPVVIKKQPPKKPKTHFDELEDDLRVLKEKISRL